MANPQKENGFTAIANEIIDNLLLYKFPDNAGVTPLKVCLFIIRKTWGFHKKKDRISITQIEKGTNARRMTVSHWVKRLVSLNILTVEKQENTTTGYVYGFNKDYDTWKKDTELKVKEKRKFSTVTIRAVESVKKEVEKEKEEATIPVLIKSFEPINPAVKRMYGNKTQRKACEDLIKQYSFERVKNVIEKTLPMTNKLPYFPTITTPIQLRDRWASLESAIYKKQSEQKAKQEKYPII